MITIMFVTKHFEKFKEFFPVPLDFSSGNTREGRNPRTWFKRIASGLDIAVSNLPSAVNRRMLLAMARDPAVRTLDLCVSIFAWGGMHGKNCRQLFEQPLDPWITIADKVRSNQLTRSQAYDAFASLRTFGKSSVIAGLGPAYFTKLLYFLAPEGPTGAKGYIMDQWLGCSVNLLTGRQVVKLDHQWTWRSKKGALLVQIGSFVSKVNTGSDYETFCRTVEALSSEMGAPWTPELTERALIADGGRSPHPWREYVVEQRRQMFERI